MELSEGPSCACVHGFTQMPLSMSYFWLACCAFAAAAVVLCQLLGFFFKKPAVIMEERCLESKSNAPQMKHIPSLQLVLIPLLFEDQPFFLCLSTFFFSFFSFLTDDSGFLFFFLLIFLFMCHNFGISYSYSFLILFLIKYKWSFSKNFVLFREVFQTKFCIFYCLWWPLLFSSFEKKSENVVRLLLQWFVDLYIKTQAKGRHLWP